MDGAEVNTDSAPRAPEGVDVEKPSAARIYDWYLGGTQNWAVDREFGRRMEQQWPLVKPGARQNREFMNRAVRAALRAGIRQFIDLGSGVPTSGNVHEAGEALEGLRWFVEQYRKTSNPVWLRSREEIEPLFGDWKLLEPGITHLPDWRPDRTLNPLEAEARPFAWCGIAEKA